jgi:probable O-glycosylation ligase (exosortase A-associated)
MLVARQPEAAWDKLVEVTKILVMTIATIVLFQDRRKVDLLLLVMALSIGVYGVSGGLWSLYTGFQDLLYGPASSSIDDNTALGYAFTIIGPILVLLRRQFDNVWIRRVLLLTFGFSIVGVFATYGRGALTGLCIVLPLTLVLSWRSDVPVLLAAVAACLVIYVTPRQWVERMQTITPTAYRDDGSGSKRMKSWYVAVRLGLDHPLLGAGFRPFEPDVYELYLPGYWDNHDAHNHYLQVFAEHGFTGLLLFVALLVCLFQTLWRIERMTRGDPQRQWVHRSALFVGVSLVAYAVGGVFLSMAYFDLFYELVAVVVILQKAALSPVNTIAEPEPPLLQSVLERVRGN